MAAGSHAPNATFVLDELEVDPFAAELARGERRRTLGLPLVMLWPMPAAAQVRTAPPGLRETITH